jgi:hypothetical protein
MTVKIRFLIVFSGLLLFASLTLADTVVPCAAASVQFYTTMTSGCSEAGYLATFNIIGNAGINLNNLQVIPLMTGGQRGFDLISNGPLSGDYTFTFSLVALGANKIKSFTETVNGTSVTDVGYACSTPNSCGYFNLNSWGNNTIMYNYSPGSSTLLSHEDVNIITGGTYVSVDKVVNLTPEPASVGLIGIGLVAIALFRRRRLSSVRGVNPNTLQIEDTTRSEV